MSAKPGDRKLHAALVAALATLVFALAPGVASADTFVDDTIADFPSGASTWAVEPGVVLRRPAMLSMNFDGPHGLEATPPEAATVDAGALTVNAGRVNTPGFSSLPQTLEFRATFGADDRQHIGFGDDLNRPLWAIFSTGGPDDPAALRARTQVDGTTSAFTPLPGVDPTVPHTYRIEWGLTSVSYFVDGNLAATHNLAITSSMRPIVSDSSAAGVVTVDWLAQGTVAAPAVFESRVRDTSYNHVLWGAVTTTPGDIAIQTRTGNTPTPDGSWSGWEATGAAGAILSPRRRFIQYSATLTEDDPVLDGVEITYYIEPTAAINGVQVWDGDATVAFSSPDPGIDDFECSIDGGEFAWCASPFVFNNLATGSHTVRVRALDEAVPPHVGPIVSVTFYVDATAPSVVIDSVGVSGADASVAFSSADLDVDEYECKLDAGDFAPCTSPKLFDNLATDSYTVRVRAIDVTGNVGASDSVDFVVDVTAPTVVIGAAHVSGSQVTVPFSSLAADVDHFECALGVGAFAPCTSPKLFDNLATGSYTVRVRAVDEVGNVGASDSVDFVVDVTAPTVVIGAAHVSGSQVTVPFSSLAADVDHFECALGVGAFAPCTSPKVFDNLATGSYTVRVRAVDEVGNVGASDSVDFVVDVTAPTATIGGVQVSGDDASVSFSSLAADVDHFECALGAGAFAPCTSPKVFDNLATGLYTVRVRAVDEVGNVGPGDSVDFVVDVTAPTATIGGVQVSGDDASVSFSSLAADVDHFECALGVGAFAPCTSPKVFDNLATGSYTVRVRAVDEVGNVGASDSVDFVVDVTAPTATIGGVQVSGDDASVSFSSLAADVDHFECALGVGAFAPCTSPKVFDNLATGSYTVRVRAVDEVGNVGPGDSVDFVVDVTAPTATIGGVQVSGDDASVSFSSLAADVDHFECALGAGAFSPCTSPKVFDNLATGSYTVRVRAVDEVGNVGPGDSVDFEIDVTAPTATIGGVQASGDKATVTFSSPDADVVAFECAVDGGAYSTCTSAAVFSGIAPGVHTVRVRARDVAGNIGASDARSFTIETPAPPPVLRDTTAPVVEVPSRRARVSKRGSVTVKVACPAGETRCRLTLRAGSGAKKSAIVGGGKTAKVPLKLTTATRRKLAARGRLSVKIQVVARDDAGNRSTKEYRFTLLAPR